MKTIELRIFGIVVALDPHSGGAITDELHEEGEDNYNYAMDGITSMILAHACAGVDIESPAYLKGIEDAVYACENNIAD